MKRTQRFWMSSAAIAFAWAASGCLQILGDDADFVARGGSGGSGASGANGGTGGTGANAGNGGTGANAGNGGTGGTTTFCAPNETKACYSGGAGTEGVGVCKAGTQTCNGDGLDFGPCEGEVLPGAEDPKVIGDEACDGFAHGEALWSQVIGDAGEQVGFYAAGSKTEDAIYVSGYYDAPFQVGPDLLTVQGTASGFILKLDTNGQPIWSKVLPNVPPLGTPLVSGATDGGLIVTGFFEAAVDLGGGSLGPGTALFKLDKDGNYMWGHTCSASTVAFITATFEGEAVLWSDFTGTVNCGSLPQTSTGPKDLFLGKISEATGDMIWTKRFGNGDTANAGFVAFDPVGNILAATYFEGAAFTKFGNYGVSDQSGQGSAIVKFDGSGEAQWAYEILGLDDQQVTFLAPDGTGGVVVSGAFDSEFKLPGNDLVSGDPMLNHFFFVRVDADGQTVWRKAVSLEGYGLAPSLNVSDDTIVLTGLLNMGTLNLGGDDLVTTAFGGYVAGLSLTDASHVWSRTFGSLWSFPLSTVDSAGRMIVTGATNGSVDFGNGPLLSKGPDIFVAKLAP